MKKTYQSPTAISYTLAPASDIMINVSGGTGTDILNKDDNFEPCDD